MEELEQILRTHARKYPLMQPRDGVKLIYQNTFGGGHLIRDPEACRRMLLQEYETAPRTPGGPLLEDIGNGILRVMLGALEGSGYTPEQLAGDFVRSSEAHRGSLEEFLPKLDVLRKVTAEGCFGFSSEELEEYLTRYKESGCPMVSHSPQYRQAYQPAYRIVLRSVLPEHLK